MYSDLQGTITKYFKNKLCWWVCKIPEPLSLCFFIATTNDVWKMQQKNLSKWIILQTTEQTESVPRNKNKKECPISPISVDSSVCIYSYRNLMVRLLGAVGVCLSTHLIEESQLFAISFIKAEGPYPLRCVYIHVVHKESVEGGSSFSSIIN